MTFCVKRRLCHAHADAPGTADAAQQTKATSTAEVQGALRQARHSCTMLRTNEAQERTNGGAALRKVLIVSQVCHLSWHMFGRYYAKCRSDDSMYEQGKPDQVRSSRLLRMHLQTDVICMLE